MANEDNKLKGEFSYHHKLIRVYNGKGHVHRYKNRPLDCQFECVQTVEGKIFFKFDSFDPDLVINSEKVSCLSGYSDKGQYLHLNTPIFLTATNFQYTYSADELLSVEASGMLNPEEIKELKFYLTNFKFIGRPRQWRLDGHDVTIKRVENYEDVIREIQATKSVDVTVEMSIKLPYSDTTLDITRVEKLATDVCHLLSLAKGCKVQWLFWDAFSASGHRVKSYHWAPWITPYSSMDLVVDNPPEDIDEFILATFDNFRKENSKGIWKLDEAIDHYVNSILERGLIELRALNLVALMEYLTGCYADHHNIIYFLEPIRFYEQKKELQRRIRDILEKCFQAEDLVKKDEQVKNVFNDMANKIEELNRRSFNTVLKQLMSSLQLEIDKEERQKFIKIRNALVHKAQFLEAEEKIGNQKNTEENTEDDKKQFLRVVAFVSRVMLAILRYRGYYYDWHLHKPGDWAGPKLQGRVKMPCPDNKASPASQK